MEKLEFEYDGSNCGRDCSVKYHHSNCAHTRAELESELVSQEIKLKSDILSEQQVNDELKEELKQANDKLRAFCEGLEICELDRLLAKGQAGDFRKLGMLMAESMKENRQELQQANKVVEVLAIAAHKGVNLSGKGVQNIIKEAKLEAMTDDEYAKAEGR